MATNKLQWKRIAKGEKLPCDSLLMKKDGTITSVVSGAGVKVGQDAYYLPVGELKSFPKEKSEDERMIQYFKDLAPFDKAEELYMKYGFSHKDAIAWLEKQGEHKKFRDSIQVGDKVTRNEEGVLVNLSQLNRVAKKDEKQGEQNHTDKVKTKFHEGDWVILTAGELSTTLQIVKVDTNKKLYWFNDSSYLPIVDEECLHFWTIQDAKDGDVVVDKSDGTIGIFQSIGSHPDGGCYNDPSYCFLHCHCDDEFFYADFENGNEIDSDDLVTATKEQRDLLFEKMKEAGYEWDAEKKELRKIEQKPVPKFKVGDVVRSSNGVSLLIVGITDYCYNCVTCATNDEYSFGFDIQDEFELVEQKPTEWSEEDEALLKLSLENLTELKDRFGKEYGRVGGCIDWLKSLKDRSAWKPSDAHYELEEFAKIVRGNLTGISKNVQKLFEAKYLQLTGNKMYGGLKD